MKKFLLLLCILGIQKISVAQTNTFPSSGNTGVGTTDPDHRLQVKGTSGDGSLSPQEDLLHIGGNELGGAGGYAGLKLGGTSDSRYYTYLRAVKTLGYGNYWNSALTLGVTRSLTYSTQDEVMRLTSDGNVGIGTTDPQGYKLAVNGNMIAESVKVKLHANWPDYVFEPSYRLPALKETEQFIEKNGHLPEIPSAKEVAEDGINLGDMNARLLKKIEELTLHLIRLEKEVKSLKNSDKNILTPTHN